MTRRFTHNGPSPAESFIEVQRGPNLIKHGIRFRKDPITCILGTHEYATLSWTSETIDGNLFRSMTDDNAPYNVNGVYVGGQHGLGGALITSTGHGKTTASVGSRWGLGGDEFVILKVVNGNQLLVTRRGGFTTPPVGTYTHIAGGGPTANIVATVSVPQIWHPMTCDYRMDISVDGCPVENVAAAPVDYRDNVTFVETYGIITREEVINHAIATGNGWETSLTGNPLFAVSNAYQYDREGHLTIYADFIVLRPLTVTQIHGFAVQWCNATQWYIPKTIPFVHDGVTKNFSMIENVVPLASELVFNDNNAVAGGLFLDRFISMNTNYALAVGFAPLQDAEPTGRRINFITGLNAALNIPTDRKARLRLTNVGGYAALPGDRWSWIGYRNVIVRNPERTVCYPVRTNEADFLFVDWHNKNAVDRVPLLPDFHGRPFSVVDQSATVDVLSEHLNGSLLVDVNATGGNAYLVLRMDR